jgi:putative transposase
LPVLVRKAYRFRAYPDSELAERCTRAIGCVRLVYNLALSQRETFGRRGRRLDPSAELVELKREFPFMREDAFSQSLQQALRDLDKAYERFFAGLSGYPQPRRKFESDSMRFPQPYAKNGPQIVLGHDSIKLPKFGWVGIERHRKVKGRLRNVTVKLEGGQWFVILQTEIEAKDRPVREDLPSVGLDMGVNQPITTSTGEVVALPQVSKTENKKRAALCRVMSRRKKGSAGRMQARLALRRFDRHMANRRNDARHKETTRLVKNHGLIGIEDLQVRNMTRSAHGSVEEPGKKVAQKAGLNRRMLDVAPGAVRLQLEYKGIWYGSVIEPVPPANTTQDCAACGARNRVVRGDRVIDCVACGTVKCRDTNAALNIERRAVEQYGRRIGGVSPWIEPNCRPESETLKSATVAAATQAERSPGLQAGE